MRLSQPTPRSFVPSRPTSPMIDTMALKRIKPIPRTPEQIADEERVRELFQDRPSVRSLIERGEIDPERISSGSAEESLLKTLTELKRARQARGMTLTEIA